MNPEETPAPRRVVPRETRYECQECGWQGRYVETDAGQCPACGGDVELIQD